MSDTLPKPDTADFAGEACWERVFPDGRIQCLLCPRHCRLAPGQEGFCRVRSNRDGHITCSAFERWSGGCVDPIEKKPLYHFLPGSRIYSFGTHGCNLACRFCQNWHLSQIKTAQAAFNSIEPTRIAEEALAQGCPSVAFTYNDPVIYADLAIVTARLCHAHRIRTVAVTAGYIEPKPREMFFSVMDAANVDLKSFDDSVYRRYCGARLAPVLDTLRYIHRETPVWLEVTTLLIPELNDSDVELDRASDWFAQNLGNDVPWHFSVFHPSHKMRDRPQTPVNIVARACAIAHSKGIRYVYAGNIYNSADCSTRCPGCGALLIERMGFDSNVYFSKKGACPNCGFRLAGVWG